MAPLKRFLHPYYVVNTLLVLSWAGFRHFFDTSRLQTAFFGALVSGEISLFFSMTLFLYKKFKRCNTWDSFVAKTFVFYQALVWFMLYYVSVTAMIWYSVACVLSFLLFRQPPGGHSKNIEVLDEISFEVNITSQKKKKDGVAWLVFFTANWHPECTFFSHVFADMADEFGATDKLKFGQVDDRYKSIFEAHQVCSVSWRSWSCHRICSFYR